MSTQVPWTASYGDGAEEISYPHAETAREAAQEYVYSDDIPDEAETVYRSVHVWRGTGEQRQDETTVVIRIDPDEPECVDGHNHDWCSPYAVLGGIKENPGVVARGAGVVIREVCRHCGRYRVTDTSGDESVKYEEADEESRAWIRSKL